MYVHVYIFWLKLLLVEVAPYLGILVCNVVLVISVCRAPARLLGKEATAAGVDGGEGAKGPPCSSTRTVVRLEGSNRDSPEVRSIASSTIFPSEAICLAASAAQQHVRVINTPL